MNNLLRACAALMLMAGAGLGILAPKADAADQKVTLGLATTSVSASYAFIAQSEGYWKKLGLDVDVTVIPGGQGSRAMLAGDIEFAHSSGTNILASVAHGQPAIAIGALHSQLYYELVISKEAAAKTGLTLENSTPLQRAKAIKGLTLAVDGPNTIQDAFLTHIVIRGGIDPQKDITRANLEAGAVNPAMEAKRIDGFIANPPYSSIAEQKGTGILWISGARRDFPELDPFVNTIISARTDYCQKNADICTRFLAGIRQAIALEISDPEKSVQIITPQFKNMDPALLKAAFEQQRGVLSRDMKFTDAQFANTQKFALETGMLKPTEQLKSFDGVAYTNAYLK